MFLLVGLTFRSDTLCTFFLDKKSNKKIKAPEKWLKITAHSYRQRTRPIDTFTSGYNGLKQRWSLSASQKDGLLRNFLNAIFLRPVRSKFYRTTMFV
jgi:hypothetical protein